MQQIKKKAFNNNTEIFSSYYTFELSVREERKKIKMKHTYFLIFIFLKYSDQQICTSAYPGQFRPYQMNWRDYWIYQIFGLGLKRLCDAGLIKKVKYSEYQFTIEGNHVYRIFQNNYNKRQKLQM